tara:strand:- start:68 stop:385 length:318 start_codon:yes stop_codon:yes gene_type:complete
MKKSEIRKIIKEEMQLEMLQIPSPLSAKQFCDMQEFDGIKQMIKQIRDLSVKKARGYDEREEILKIVFETYEQIAYAYKKGNCEEVADLIEGLLAFYREGIVTEL